MDIEKTNNLRISPKSNIIIIVKMQQTDADLSLDKSFNNRMKKAVTKILPYISGLKCVYVKSKTVVFLINDLKPGSKSWMNFDVQKMNSVITSLMTLFFNNGKNRYYFSSHLFVIPSDQIIDYFWRKIRQGLSHTAGSIAKNLMPSHEIQHESLEQLLANKEINKIIEKLRYNIKYGIFFFGNKYTEFKRELTYENFKVFFKSEIGII